MPGDPGGVTAKPQEKLAKATRGWLAPARCIPTYPWLSRLGSSWSPGPPASLALDLLRLVVQPVCSDLFSSGAPPEQVGEPRLSREEPEPTL